MNPATAISVFLLGTYVSGVFMHSVSFNLSLQDASDSFLNSVVILLRM